MDVQVTGSESALCHGIARAYKGCFKEDFGVCRVEMEKQTIHVRYATDHDVPPGSLALPLWLYQLSEYPRRATVHPIPSCGMTSVFIASNIVDLKTVAKMELRLMEEYLPLPTEPETIVSQLRQQMLDQLVWRGNCHLLLIILGRHVLVQVRTLFNFDGDVALVDRNTTINVVFSERRLISEKSLSQHLMGPLTQLNATLQKHDKRPRMVILHNVDVHDRGVMMDYLRSRHRVVTLPLQLLVRNADLNSFEDEARGRLEIFDRWCHENISLHPPSIIYASHLDLFPSPYIHMLLAAAERSQFWHSKGHLLMFVSWKEPSPDVIRVYGETSVQVIEVKNTGLVMDGEASFIHDYQQERLGLCEAESLDRLKRQRQERDYESVGALLRPGQASWEEVCGYAQIKTDIQRTLYQSIKYPDRLKQFGLRPVKGLLLHGPSGCGKTMMVKAIANDGLLPVIQLRPTDVLSKYLGESEATLRRVFARARQLRPCILYIDNIEVLGARRGVSSAASETDASGSSLRLLSTLLTEMDGVVGSEGIIIIACTNSKDDLDDALIRPGRIDHHLLVDLPSEDDLSLLLGMHLRKLFIDTPDHVQTLERLKRHFSGHSCAHIVSDLNGFALAHIHQPLPLRGDDLLQWLHNRINH